MTTPAQIIQLGPGQGPAFSAVGDVYRMLATGEQTGGAYVLSEARVLPGGKAAGSRLSKGLAGAAMARIATRSVPGAIVVGGGLLAKMLYDRRHAKAGPPAPSAQKPATPEDEDTDAVG